MKLRKKKVEITNELLKEINCRNPTLALKITRAIDMGRKVFCVNSIVPTLSNGKAVFNMKTTVYMDKDGGEAVEIGTVERPILMTNI